ncbi:MAG: glycosyltransferase, partial [Pseudomonadota bacterium]
LKEKGFTPDVIVAHPGWGEALFAKDIFPDTPLLNYFEFYYRAYGADVGFNPEDEISVDDKCRIRVKNTVNFLALEAADAGMSPTFWQYSRNPEEFHYKISVIHDGIDTNMCRPDPRATLTLDDGRVLSRDDEVITYVARNLEPYRGFPQFMCAVEMLQKERPNAHFVIVGADGISYGRAPKEGGTWKEKCLAEVSLDMDRVHFLDSVPYVRFAEVLRVSAAHIYLTYPFVLSWSMMEAMSSGCLIVGSRTAPVEEVIRDGENGLLVDFFKPEEVVEQVVRVLEHPDQMQDIRDAARQTVMDHYDLEKCLAGQITMIKNLVNGHRPVMHHPRWEPGKPVFEKPKATGSGKAA